MGRDRSNFWTVMMMLLTAVEVASLADIDSARLSGM
jgi:hypothetical protein